MSQTIFQTEMLPSSCWASLLFAINTLQIEGTPNTPTFCHSDKTKAQLLGSRLKEWNFLENGVTV